MKRDVIVLAIIVLLSGIGLVWLASAQEPGDIALIERGQVLFLAKGCTACHGAKAQGTDLAPALGGHSEYAVRRQVRAPVGIMPVFGPQTITDVELDALVAYVTSLPMIEETDTDAHEHEQGTVAKGDVSFAHHWLLWLALEAEDTDIALHQAAHLLEYVEGAHAFEIQSVIMALTDSDLETARAVIEPMVTGVGTFSDDPAVVTLQMAYIGASAEDAEVTEHFITDFTENYATEDDAEFAASLLEQVEAGELDALIALLDERLGDEVDFVVAEDMATADSAEETETPGADGHGG